MTHVPHILIVDDDERLRELLKKFLHENNMRISTASDAAKAAELLKIFVFDLMILDVMMPGETGFEFIQRLKTTSDRLQSLPVLLLTAMGEVDHRIEGLSYGADDYLSKPFDPRELLLRIQVILKRTQAYDSAIKIKLGSVIYDPETNHLSLNNNAISLTTVESNLLKILSKYPGRPLSREELVELYGEEMNPRTIDVQMTRLRRKIEKDPKLPRYLQTVRGKGYVLMTDTE
ncbi:OmpR superfamily DNA-binding transcriptional regulator [Candidatus Bealeia paramacronuclearis]|uniref:OmpR superfamily DNA-binding transcriptional regulator n=1 Tax=Candidatus Bealeia paramacronuclearis TaxID=1921001 RepID=A0ABZ2C611_9PROT|nr:OmpR superfamily DNA-binding transcriptional regulator [Candidatus Bealeia paramacronuclearis]